MTCEESEWWDEFCSMWGDVFGRTIEAMLAEWGDPPFTYADYLEEKAEVEMLIYERYNLRPYEIAAALEDGRLPDRDVSDLVDRWCLNETVGEVLRP